MYDPCEYWDGIDVHFCVQVEQSSQDAGMACNKILSTRPNPNLKQENYDVLSGPERRLGYGFDPALVTCHDCIIWMNNNLNRCKSCQGLARWNYCRACAEKLVG
ncbi:MAG TPA: hypothetical protein VI423_02180 [Paenisporosarcina sp.]|nr:hypothetical protein [Paenisporosarcina sp.]